MVSKVCRFAVLLIIVSAFTNFGIAVQAGPNSAVLPQGGWVMASAQDTGKQGTGAENGSIILIGASYAAGLNMETIAGRRLVNKGIGGEQSFETLARFDQEVIALKPDAVIMWGFINDIFRSEREKVDSAVERIKTSYVAMIGKAIENGITPILATEVTMSPRPGAKAWAMSLIPRMMGKTSYQEYVNGHVMQANQWLKAYAAENGIAILDLQSLLAEGDVMRKTKYSQPDGSHISDEGYRLIADHIREHAKL
jgi:lysophospholipase L1-like esterase